MFKFLNRIITAMNSDPNTEKETDTLKENDCPPMEPAPADTAPEEAQTQEEKEEPTEAPAPADTATDEQAPVENTTKDDSTAILSDIRTLLVDLKDSLASKSEKDTQKRDELEGYCRDGVEKIQQELAELKDSFETKLQYDESKQVVIDRQHEELERYRRDAANKVTRAIIMDIITEIDGAERTAQYLTQEPIPEPENCTQEDIVKLIAQVKKLQKLVGSFSENLRDILENYDVFAYQSEAGARFDGKLHSALETIPTEDPELVRTIARSIRWGFSLNDKVLRPEKVAVYVQQKPETPAE